MDFWRNEQKIHFLHVFSGIKCGAFCEKSAIFKTSLSHPGYTLGIPFPTQDMVFSLLHFLDMFVLHAVLFYRVLSDIFHVQVWGRGEIYLCFYYEYYILPL